jgi:hypothetical protein
MDEAGSGSQAVIPARDGIEALVRRSSACTVASAAADATTPPYWPQSPCPSWRPDEPDHDGHLDAQLARLARRAIRCPAAPGATGS